MIWSIFSRKYKGKSSLGREKEKAVFETGREEREKL